MINKLLWVGWLGLAAFVLIGNAGCASKRGGGGCSGGCCRGKTPEFSAPPAVPPASEGDVTYMRPPPAAPPAPAAAVAASSPYGGQKTCPVTGEELGSMGTPIPVTVNGQTLYVCCQGCAGKVRKNPDAYLAKVIRERQGN